MTRNPEDYIRALLRAQIRAARRGLVLHELTQGFPSLAVWQALDLVHEAKALVSRLEERAIRASESRIRHDAVIGALFEACQAAMDELADADEPMVMPDIPVALDVYWNGSR